MIGAMLLAHLVGDYILQWDRLALWKSRELKGVMAHGLVVFLVTWLFAIPFDPYWRGIFFIGLAHIVIDAAQLYIKPPITPLTRFTLDQLAHFLVIGVALMADGYLDFSGLSWQLIQSAHSDRILFYLIGYAFITMPTWVIAKFIAYGLVNGTGPNFPEGTNKYIGILERLLMTTFVVMGQFLLVPLVTMPRLVWEWPQVSHSERAPVYLVELLCSITVAVGIGLALSWV